MEKRQLGKTGLNLSLLGFGGFHLCEIPYSEADLLLNSYLDLGGNYIETAPSYGGGESEIKIGRAISHRRSEFILATKAHQRDYGTCKKTIEQSLINLKTNTIDLLLMHAVDTVDTLNQILSKNGAIRAAEEAVRAGKVKHIGISMHGHPESLIEALKRYPFEAVMTTINYYDNCNFPDIMDKLVPLALEKGVGIIVMKPLGDGYLYHNAQQAFRYAFSQPVSVVVSGMNTVDMLNADFKLAEAFVPMTIEEQLRLLKTAPELGNYVCRQCGQCMPCREGIDIPYHFFLEALFDRQMDDGSVADVAEYALKERLKHWFGTHVQAQEKYSVLKTKASDCNECGDCMQRCPYDIDIIKKLKNVDYKLSPSYGKIRS